MRVRFKENSYLGGLETKFLPVAFVTSFLTDSLGPVSFFFFNCSPKQLHCFQFPGIPWASGSTWCIKTHVCVTLHQGTYYYDEFYRCE